MMFIGVAFFSLVIGEFIHIIDNFDKKLYVIDKGLDLHMWVTSLLSFTGDHPLPKKLVNDIDNHFKFFWREEKLQWMT